MRLWIRSRSPSWRRRRGAASSSRTAASSRRSPPAPRPPAGRCHVRRLAPRGDPRPRQHPPPHVPDADARASGGDQQGALSLAASAVSDLGAEREAENFRLATRLALTELLMSGCTCASDHHYLYPPGLEDAMDIQAEEAAALGIRMTLTRGSLNLTGEEGGNAPPAASRTPTPSSPTASA